MKERRRVKGERERESNVKRGERNRELMYSFLYHQVCFFLSEREVAMHGHDKRYLKMKLKENVPYLQSYKIYISHREEFYLGSIVERDSIYGN